MNYEKTGLLIQETRKEKNLTQAQLADMLGVTDRAISKWERAKSFPDVAMLKPLAEALDLSVVELLDGERRAEEPLTGEEAVETAIKGIQAYVSENERRQRTCKLLAVIVLILAVAAFCLWKYAHRPVDFSEGVFDFSAAAVDQEGEDRFTMALDGGSYDQMVKAHVKTLLAGNMGAMREVSSLPDSEEWVYLNDPKDDSKALVSFSPDGYADHRSGKYYTCSYSESLYYDLKSIFTDFYGTMSGEYQYDGKTVYRYNGRKLVLDVLPKSPAEELIVEKLRQDMLEDSIPEFPDAYRSEVRVQAINWVLPEEYDEEELFFIEKEVDLQRLYDYRFYEVITEETYTDALKVLGPQYPEGKQTYLYLLGKKTSDTVFSICYYTRAYRVSD